MAEHQITAKSIALKIDPAGGTDYDTVVCLTEITRSDTVSSSDANSFCGSNKGRGTLEIGERTFTGFHLMDPDTGKVSGANLRALMYSGATVGYSIGPISPEEGDETEVGTAFISSLGDTYGLEGDATFNGAIQPYGTPEYNIATS